MIILKKEFHVGNRQRLYTGMKEHSLLVLFSGQSLRKTNDEFYPFYTNRNFLYLTGLDSKDFVLMAAKDEQGKVSERIYILPPDAMAERWNGERLKPNQVLDLSGIEDIRFVMNFERDFHNIAQSGNYENIYLDFYRADHDDAHLPAHNFWKRVNKEYPYLHVEDASISIRRQRLIKQPCEIEAMKEAEKITRAGIVAMMKASKPGMYEYQYKAEFDYALGQYGPQGPAFPPTISAGKNNFCIHYYGYKGQAKDGDMILNDVGAWYDNVMNDVSRGWPCNGKFDEKQKLLYECALRTSDYMFSKIAPGMRMRDVDGGIKEYNAQLLKDAGVMKSLDEVGTYMWHGGAHHVGYDVHDVVETPEIIQPGMVFCVDVGIYHEEWGIGFRLEDNCLVTENGCENLSAITPRTIEEIEDMMCKGSKMVSI